MKMKFWHKALLAIMVTIVSPFIIGLALDFKFSKDLFLLCLPALIYIVPLLAISIFMRRVYDLKNLAVGIFGTGMLAFLGFAISTLWAELHGPLFGYIYIPVIIVAAPLGLFAILDGRKKKA